jgi:hypothetical protein
VTPDLPFDRPFTVARWRFGWLTVRWSSGVRGIFSSWSAALFALTGTDSLRVRP